MDAMANDWSGFRRLMPVSRQLAYFDHAAVAPLPAPTFDTIATWAQQSAELGDTVWPDWERGRNRVRELAAELIHASPDEIALVPNTSTGINFVAEGFPWRAGDNVVTLANEFPSNLYPWMNQASRGVETRRIPVENGRVDPERVIAACDARTRLISISWVGYASGWRIDVAGVVQLAHDRGIHVFLDAIQGLGVFPLDVAETGVDYLAADGHKWMLGPEGAGIFYVRREHLDHLRPLYVGWNSVVHAFDFGKSELNLKPTAARYEGGSQNMAGFLGLAASLQLLQRFGLSSSQSPLAQRILELTDYAAQQLASIGAQLISRPPEPHRSGILVFDFAGHDPTELRKRCLQAGVVLSVRGGGLRISPHAYNNEEDIDRLVEALK